MVMGSTLSSEVQVKRIHALADVMAPDPEQAAQVLLMVHQVTVRPCAMVPQVLADQFWGAVKSESRDPAVDGVVVSTSSAAIGNGLGWGRLADPAAIKPDDFSGSGGHNGSGGRG